MSHLAYSSDDHMLVTASWDGSVRLWDTRTGKEIHRLEGHDSEINHVAFAPDGETIITSSDDKTARIWNIARPPDLAGRLRVTGARTNYRVCEDTLEVVAVIPVPPAESVWAPPALCGQAAP